MKNLTVSDFIKKSNRNRSNKSIKEPVFFEGDKCLVINPHYNGVDMLSVVVVKSDKGDINRQHHVCVLIESKGSADYGEFFKAWVNKFDLFLN
jgi:hypothetical protein